MNKQKLLAKIRNTAVILFGHVLRYVITPVFAVFNRIITSTLRAAKNSPHFRKRLIEWLIILALSGVAYTLATVFNVFDKVVEVAIRHDVMQHLLTILVILLFVLIIFTLRRLHDLKIEVTERQRAEASLRQQTAKLREQAHLLDLAHDSIIVFDLANKIMFWNDGAVRMYGWSKDEALGKIARTLLQTKFPKPLEEILSEVATKGRWEGELVHTRQDGTPIVVASRWALQRDEQENAGAILEINSEITEQKRTREALEEAHENLKQWIKALKKRNEEINLFSQLGELLQTALTEAEAYQIISHFAAQLFPDDSGALYVFNASRNLLEARSVWGKNISTEEVFTPQDCWAIRRGRPHLLRANHPVLPCRHTDKITGDYVCIPMSAQGETLGVLRVLFNSAGQTEDNESQLEVKQQLAQNLAEHLSLSLANLKLRQALRNTSIHDVVTGLFNRRYMEESLERELARVQRKNLPLGIIMLDLDHFKDFNDKFGHKAGDMLLHEFGAILQQNVRGSDIACRYGGEEFVLIMPEASLETTYQRAEQLRESVKTLKIPYGNQSLGNIHLSAGIALFPTHGSSVETIMKASDTALYQAKREGRDRVVVAGTA